MQGLGLRTLLKSFPSSHLTTHFDRSVNQLRRTITTEDGTHWKTTKYIEKAPIKTTLEILETNDADQKQKRDKDAKLIKRLQDIALYAYVNQDTFMDLYRNRDDKFKLLNDEWRNSPALNTKSKEFIQNILKNIDEVVREYKSSDEKYSPEPDKDGSKGGNERDTVSDEDSQKFHKRSASIALLNGFMFGALTTHLMWCIGLRFFT